MLAYCPAKLALKHFVVMTFFMVSCTQEYAMAVKFSVGMFLCVRSNSFRFVSQNAETNRFTGSRTTVNQYLREELLVNLDALQLPLHMTVRMELDPLFALATYTRLLCTSC